MAAALAAGAMLFAGAGAWAAPAQADVTIAVMPRDIAPTDLADAQGMSVGVMSAGLSKVSATQTYLDVGAGNRVFTSLYPGEDPIIGGFETEVPGWNEIVERADGAPADIVPGLLASTLQQAGVPIQAEQGMRTPALIAANRDGKVVRSPTCLVQRCAGVAVIGAGLDDLPALVGRLHGDDLLIAIEAAPPPKRDTLAIGIAGLGQGDLTSDTTRTDGFVLATDVAPTILEHYGVPIPDEVSGESIRAEGEPDAAGVADRAERMRVVAGRRAEVILYNLMIWAALAGLAAWVSRGRATSPALGLLGLSVVYLPLMLLVGAAVQPSELVERLIVGLGAPALAALTLYLRRGWDALAIACGLTVGAYAVDVIAGSSLTASSLLGPNPGLGVRFFGIGNELEATLAVLIPIGTGAALAALSAAGRAPSARACAISFLVVGGAAAVIFAAGRFGADVGAAIVLPAAAVAAALAVPGALRGRRVVLALIAAPVVGLALLAAIDLVLGGDAHLSKSVFEAGGADELAEVFERRLRLSAGSFGSAVTRAIFWFAVLLVVAAVVFRRRLLALLAQAPLVRAGFAGAAGAVVLGVIANDSGAIFLIIGTIAMLGCLAFARGRIGTLS